jgi:hypothetical protein
MVQAVRAVRTGSAATTDGHPPVRLGSVILIEFRCYARRLGCGHDFSDRPRAARVACDHAGRTRTQPDIRRVSRSITAYVVTPSAAQAPTGPQQSCRSHVLIQPESQSPRCPPLDARQNSERVKWPVHVNGRTVGQKSFEDGAVGRAERHMSDLAPQGSSWEPTVIPA